MRSIALGLVASMPELTDLAALLTSMGAKVDVGGRVLASLFSRNRGGSRWQALVFPR